MLLGEDPQAHRIAQLRDLCCRSVTFSQLQQILSDLYGPILISSLPIGAVTYIEYCQEMALALERRGLISADLFRKLVERVPQRRVDIANVAQSLGVSLSTDDLVESKITSTPTDEPISLRNLDLVKVDTGLGESNPQRFFLGNPPTWADLAANLDVHRSVIFQNDRISYAQFRGYIRSAPLSHLCLVFGEGGAGKSTLLRRLMYDLVTSEATVFRAYYETALRINDVVKYAHTNPTLPIYIFLDNAQTQARNLIALSNELSMFPNRLAIIGAARKNEWNHATRRLSLAPYDEIYLPSITEFEASDLLNKLKEHNSLGRLAELSSDEQLKAITVTAKKQLFVSLLEATQGKQFRQIVLDEYHGIGNDDARFLYLAMCVVAHLRVRMSEDVAIVLSRADSRVSFTSSLIPMLELVIGHQDVQGISALIPRHRSIGEELLAQLCPGPSDKLGVCLDMLDRASSVKFPQHLIQDFATRLSLRLVRKEFIDNVESAERVIELLLAAGVGTYQWGEPTTGHDLRRQYSRTTGFFYYQTIPIRIPNQFQFKASAEIARRWLGDDNAIQLIHEGLALDDRWNHLRLYQAIIEADRGNESTAEKIVQRVLMLADQNEGRGEVSLPIPLAVAIARFRKESDPIRALEYLNLANSNIKKGMLDVHSYFTNLAGLYDVLGNIGEATAVLRRGLAVVKGPAWALEKIERAFVQKVSLEDPDAFIEWVKEKYPEPEKIKTFVARAILQCAVAKRDREATLNVVRRFGSAQIVNQQLRRYVRLNDLDALSYLTDVIETEDIPFSPAVARSLLARAVLVRNKDKVLDIVHHLGNNSALLHTQLNRLLLRDILEIKELSPKAASVLLSAAIAARDPIAAAEAYARIRTSSRVLKRVIDQQSDPTVFEFLDVALGIRPTLPDEVAALLLDSAIQERDKTAFLKTCSRTRDFTQLLDPVKTRLRAEDPDAFGFLCDVLRETGTSRNPTEGVFATLSHITQFRAIGYMKGRYLSGGYDSESGSFITYDDEIFKARVQAKLFKRQSSKIETQQEFTWLVYPKLGHDEATMEFELVAIHDAPNDDDSNCFSIRGLITEVSAAERSIRVCIKPNLPWLTDFPPTNLKLEGNVPDNLVGWFCDFKATLTSRRLVMEDWEPVIRIESI